jgi:hypothetical protein
MANAVIGGDEWLAELDNEMFKESIALKTSLIFRIGNDLLAGSYHKLFLQYLMDALNKYLIDGTSTSSRIAITLP